MLKITINRTLKYKSFWIILYLLIKKKVYTVKLEKTRKTVLTALFMAIICVATLVIQIPSPATNGYFNLGDCFVLLAGWFLGPVYGIIAAGVGSALADIITGYFLYVPATFFIKAIMALVAYFIYKALNSKPFFGKIASTVTAEIIMVLGYFAYEATVLGYGIAAAASVPSNALQGIVGVASSVALASAIEKSNILKNLFR